jgi:hypothetical protein
MPPKRKASKLDSDASKASSNRNSQAKALSAGAAAGVKRSRTGTPAAATPAVSIDSEDDYSDDSDDAVDEEDMSSLLPQHQKKQAKNKTKAPELYRSDQQVHDRAERVDGCGRHQNS